jgi:hypothetical protein
LVAIFLKKKKGKEASVMQLSFGYVAVAGLLLFF